MVSTATTVTPASTPNTNTTIIGAGAGPSTGTPGGAGGGGGGQHYISQGGGQTQTYHIFPPRATRSHNTSLAASCRRPCPSTSQTSSIQCCPPPTRSFSRRTSSLPAVVVEEATTTTRPGEEGGVGVVPGGTARGTRQVEPPALDPTPPPSRPTRPRATRRATIRPTQAQPSLFRATQQLPGSLSGTKTTGTETRPATPTTGKPPANTPTPVRRSSAPARGPARPA